jgi:large subunit ribosomal protein L24
MTQRYFMRKGDQVEVLSGRERGKRGKVISVNRKKQTCLVEKVNFQKRHVRPGASAATPQGGIIEREGPLRLVNLMLVCPKCSKCTRPQYVKIESGARVRICRKCGEHIG